MNWNAVDAMLCFVWVSGWVFLAANTAVQLAGVCR